MDAVMTVQEMEARYDGEWILVGEPETTDTLEVVKGTVLYHSKDRDEMYRRAIALPAPKRYAVVFTGKMPANTAIVL